MNQIETSSGSGARSSQPYLTITGGFRPVLTHQTHCDSHSGRASHDWARWPQRPGVHGGKGNLCSPLPPRAADLWPTSKLGRMQPGRGGAGPPALYMCVSVQQPCPLLQEGNKMCMLAGWWEGGRLMWTMGLSAARGLGARACAAWECHGAVCVCVCVCVRACVLA